MQETLKKKYVLPLIALAIVGVAGTVYTLAQSGPVTAQAQTPTVQSVTQKGQDTETKADIVSPKSSAVVQQKADINEQDKADKSSDTEVEDGN